MKRVIKAVILLMLSALIGWGVMIGVYCIPVQNIDNNVRRSAEIIKAEGTYPILTDWATSRLDNYTDSWMMLEAATPVIDSAAMDSLYVHRGAIEDYDPANIIVKHYVDGIAYDDVINYTRYWHGYHIFLKPLLIVLDYSGIRILNGIIQIALVLVTCLLIIRKGLKDYLIPYVLSYLMLMPLALAKSLQFSSCFYIFTLSCIIILLLNDEQLHNDMALVFMFTGIATAFFDFLTYPVATFGVTIVFLLARMKFGSVKDTLLNLVRLGFAWGCGYAGMWSLKWVLASIVTDENVIADGLGKILFWMSTSSPSGDNVYSIPYCVRNNYFQFFTTPVSIIVLVYTVYMIYKCVATGKTASKQSYKTLIPFILIALLPAVWYILTPGHSTLHSWFTNKAVVVSVLSIMFGLVTMHRSMNRSIV